MHYVYILHSSKLNKLYKGYTGNLKNRINEHNNSKVPFTKAGKPWKLIYYQAFCNKTDAIREENFLKTGKGRERIRRLLENTLQNLNI